MLPPEFWKEGMDRLEAMSMLLAVVEAGSLSGASRRLKTPLTVSRRISDLERHLKTQPGRRLDNRSTGEIAAAT